MKKIIYILFLSAISTNCFSQIISICNDTSNAEHYNNLYKSSIPIPDSKDNLKLFNNWSGKIVGDAIHDLTLEYRNDTSYILIKGSYVWYTDPVGGIQNKLGKEFPDYCFLNIGTHELL